MKLLNTYEDRDDAEDAEALLLGERRLASERDSTETVYNLFGIPTWGNFHRLKLYNLQELAELLRRRSSWSLADSARHQEIVMALSSVAKNYGLQLPPHWS